MEWISIEERLPANDDDVIILTNKGNMHTAVCYMDRIFNDPDKNFERSWVDNLRYSDFEDYLDTGEFITHWADIHSSWRIVNG